MRKPTAIVFTLILATLAVGTPLWFALNESRNTSVEAETARALGYAKDVLHRSDVTADQVASGFKLLEQFPAAARCSDAQLDTMRQIDLVSSHIQAIGYEENGRLLCSSLGLRPSDIDLGPLALRTSAGTTVRKDAVLRSFPGVHFIVLERNGYVAIVPKDLPIDTTTPEADIALAVFSLESATPLSARGQVKAEWVKRLGSLHAVTFIDGRYLVAVQRSERYLTAAAAAVPVSYLDARSAQLAYRLVPIGVVAGLVLTAAIICLARMQLALPAALRAGLKRNEFFVLYQPIVALDTGRWVGAEALIRWRRPMGELVNPDLFIPVAEESGLVGRITERVIELVARDAASLFRRHPDFHIGLNVSASDLQSHRTLELISRMLQATAARPGNIMVEATERSLLNMDMAREVAGAMRAAGLQLAIDDFGTGYSSLSYLESLEVDFLKIDKSFVDTIGTQAAASSVITHIIRMAGDLKLRLIAEGVETEAQAQFLREHRVEFAQGWLFGKAMPFHELERHLEAAERSSASAAATLATANP